ncbi:MAG: hypothetical protein JXJ04_04220 [Spirochaetales bacterium]|nr:hypothetical protein [Spirochaetales bacterium]
MKLLPIKDKQYIAFHQKFDIFLCRGRGYKRVFICSAYCSYMSLHPYHSYNDITVHSDIELHNRDNEFVTMVYYYESQHDKIINSKKTFYKSDDYGKTWIECSEDTAGFTISKTTLLEKLQL